MIVGPRTPMYLAAVTYSRSRTDIVRLRTIRADSIQPRNISQNASQIARLALMLRMNRAMIRKAGQHEQQVDDPQGDALEPTAEVGGERPDDRRDRRRPDADDEADQHRDARPCRLIARTSRPAWVVPSLWLQLGAWRNAVWSSSV